MNDTQFTRHDLMRHYGHYLFLGLGDFPTPRTLGPEWTCTWDAAEWRHRIDRLATLGDNTLFLFVMGTHLPFRSRRYPELAEAGHPNVERNFVQEILDHCAMSGVKVFAVFSTTGHSPEYVAQRPDAAKRDREGNPVQHPVFCHNRYGAADYPLAIMDEVLTGYRGWAGVVLHPPEAADKLDRLCFCEACRDLFAHRVGGDLMSAGEDDAVRFFWRTYVEFQRDQLESYVRRALPDTPILTFNIPVIYDRCFDLLQDGIDKRTRIIDWDYNLRDEYLALLPDRLRRFARFGHEVWFMPTSGYAFLRYLDPREQERAVHRQIELALDAGVKDTVHFVGPFWWPNVEATSRWRGTPGVT
jgi:hypothetical protein